MGHIRLGDLPRTRKWQQVVVLIAEGAQIPQIAKATIIATEKALGLAIQDKGLIETVWLLMKLPLAAQGDDFVQELRSVGLIVPNSPCFMEIVSAFSEAIDRTMTNNGGRTDLGEMAQMAAVETMTLHIGTYTPSLFGTASEDAQNAFSKFSTNKQFSFIARKFFARLTFKCLEYFLSRIIYHHVGKDRRFQTLNQISEFRNALETHSQEASKIVGEFSGGWFSKTNWKKGEISRQDTAKFIHVAMKKIVAELKEGARPDGE